MKTTPSIPETAPENPAPPAGFRREFPSSPVFLGEAHEHIGCPDGVQIIWHEHRGFALTVIVDEDLNAEAALALATTITAATARMVQMEAERKA